MKEILNSVVEKLFDHIPFSRQEEELKSEISKRIVEKYKTEANGAEDIGKAGQLIERCRDLQSICSTVQYEVEDLSEYTCVDGVVSATEAKKVTNKSKKYIYGQSVLITMIFQVVIAMIQYKSFYYFLFYGIQLLIWGSILFRITRKKEKYLNKVDYKNLRFDTAGKEFIYQNSDKYAKKYMNTTMAGIAAIAYIVTSMLLCIWSSRYTWTDVAEQLFYAGFLLQIFLYLHVKNFYCKRMLDVFFAEERKKQYRKQMQAVICSSVIYFVIAAILIILFRNKVENIFNWMLTFGAVYFVGCIIYDLMFRKNIVFKNIVFNLRRVISISLVVVIALTYNVMTMDFYLTQPYINKIPKMLENEDQISYNEDTGMYTITTKKDDFKILQLTDIHLGGSFMSYSKDIKALKACYKLIETTRPDLVIVTGDMVFPMGVMSFSLNNSAPIMQFANFMRNTGIPWAFSYGNHDTESMATLNESEFDSLMKSLAFKSSGNLLYPYIQPDIYGRSNQIIEVRNEDGSLMQELFLLDSNDYIAGSKTLNEYDYIHDDQVEWYKKNVLELSEKEGYTVPSMAFFHMPIREYKYANDLYESGSSEVEYYYGIIGETAINRICASEHDSKLFSTALELGSTKAMFCGHDHYNNQSLGYKGIRLTFGYSIDYLVMPGIANDLEQRGGTLINIDKKGEFKITPYRLIDMK